MVQSGLSVPLSLLMSVIVYAGSAQLAVLPLLATAAPLWVVWATAFCVNLRFVIFSAQWRKYFGHLPRWKRLALTSSSADLTYVMFVRRFPDPHPSPEQLPYFLGSVTWLWVSWQSMATIGIVLADRVPLTWDLQFAGVLALMGLVYSMSADPTSWMPSGIAAAAAVATFVMPLRLNMLIGIAAGVGAGILLERRRANRAEVSGT